MENRVSSTSRSDRTVRAARTLLTVVAGVMLARPADAAVIIPSLDFRFGDQGIHADIGASFNFQAGDFYCVFDLRLKTPFRDDDKPDTDYGGGAGSLKVLNGALLFGYPMDRRSRRVDGATSKQLSQSRSFAGYRRDEKGRLVEQEQVETVSRVRRWRNLEQSEFWTIEAGAMTSTLGYGPSFGRILHPVAGVRWVESTHSGGYQRYWSATVHVVGPGFRLPSAFVVDPPLPNTLPVGVVGLYDLNVGPYFTLGLKAGLVPGYEWFGAVDVKIPLYF